MDLGISWLFTNMLGHSPWVRDDIPKSLKGFQCPHLPVTILCSTGVGSFCGFSFPPSTHLPHVHTVTHLRASLSKWAIRCTAPTLAVG